MTENTARGENGARRPGTIREGRFLRLRLLRDMDRPFLYTLLTSQDIGVRWRFRGAIPRPDAFEKMLWEGVLAQCIVEGLEDEVPRGIVTAYGVNMSAGTANIAVALTSEWVGKGFGVEAFYLFLEYAFDTWALRKVYLEAPEFNCAQFESAVGRYLHVEGILKEHEYYGGQYWDSIILAVYRSDVLRFWVEHQHLFGSDGRHRLSIMQHQPRSKWRKKLVAETDHGTTQGQSGAIGVPLDGEALRSS